MRPTILERRTAPALEDLRSRQPVLFRGAVANWPAVGRWTPEYLAQVVGHRRVPIEFYPTGSYYESWLSFETTVARYFELIGQSRETERYYMADFGIDDRLPELSHEIAMPACLDRNRLTFTAMFFGRNTISNVHYHVKEQALLCQVLGSKEVTLYAPQDFANLYFRRWHDHRFNFSRVRFDRIDTAEFPKVARARGVTCCLEPGDALFIPLYWGHLVKGQDWNGSVTFFWRPRLSEWRLHRTGSHALIGRAFRAGVSRPLASLLKSAFGYRLVGY